jgi:hypothetical protein
MLLGDYKGIWIAFFDDLASTDGNAGGTWMCHGRRKKQYKSYNRLIKTNILSMQELK